MFKRLLYLGYYLRTTDFAKFTKFLAFARENTGRSSLGLVLDVIGSSLKYNVSPLEYFQFHFYRLDPAARATYAGTGTMYEYQLVMNPKEARGCLDNKVEFYREYAGFVRHLTAGIDTLRGNPELIDRLLNNPSGKIVLKYSRGQCGWQVKIYPCDDFRDKDLVAFMEQEGMDLAEEYIVQHPDLMRLSPAAVNTVRIITQLNVANEVEFLGARLRISVNTHVDNMASGNFAASIDIETGVVNGPGVYGDMTRADVTVHPVTGVSIIGFQIPFWREIISMMKAAALHRPGNRSIGWDIAVTEQGPELIEGNHDWCKLVWQLPVKQGLKPVLERHLAEYRKSDLK